MEYDDEDFLDISGIRHFEYCRRKWALIHIEQQWQENLLTVEGHIFHEKAHDAEFAEKRGKLIISRGLQVFSRRLGITGVCDVVEFYESGDGVKIFGRNNLYKPSPIEYKRGKPKQTDEDDLQLAAQAICLEEMLACTIEVAYLYYGETGRRIKVDIDDAVRQKVYDITEEMHRMYERRYTPKVRTSKSCRMCSLYDLCMTKLNKNISAAGYIAEKVGEAQK
ncbi:MAG: CRISPR-associated protein Cas4 [Bacillota bacterium]|nr:CRISPR-associated protein Cas4 [Bacillota bacterium]